MVAVGAVNAAPTATIAGHSVIEVRKPIEIVQVPRQRLVLAVDLEGVERLVAARVTGRLKHRHRTILETREKRARVVDLHRLLLAGCGVNALLDKGLGHRAHRNDVAVDPTRSVDAVRKQIAGDPRACDLGVEAPEASAALGEIRGNRPILQEIGAVVEDLSELASVDDVFRQRDRGKESIVVPNEIRQLRLLDSLHHRLALLSVERERLLTQDHLAMLDAGERDIHVRVVGRADVDGVDVLAGNELTPVGFNGARVAVGGELTDLGFVTTTHRLQHRLAASLEEVRNLTDRIRVRAAHESVADQADAQLGLVGRGRGGGDGETVGELRGGLRGGLFGHDGSFLLRLSQRLHRVPKSSCATRCSKSLASRARHWGTCIRPSKCV